MTLVSVATLCAWTLCSTLANTEVDQVDLARIRGDKLDLAVGRGDKLVVLRPTAPASKIQSHLFRHRRHHAGRCNVQRPSQGASDSAAQVFEGIGKNL